MNRAPLLRILRALRMKKVDDADLLAFADSVGSSPTNSNRTSSPAAAVIVLSSPNKSPVKLHNQQFEGDFDVDWTESEDSILRLTQEGTVKSSPKIKLSQLGQHLRQEEAAKELSTIEISAPETSSPTYHRTETLYPRMRPLRPVPPTNMIRTSTGGSESFDTIVPFAVLSNEPPLKKPALYPVLKSYEEKYSSANSSIELTNPPEAVVRAPLNLSENEMFRRVIQHSINTPMEMPAPPVQSSRIGVESLNNLMRRPKPSNPQLLLMTQKATINSLDQTRSMSTAAQPKVVQTMVLSEEQTHVIDLVKKGKSLFYTGSAGTGKSVLLKSLIKTLKEKYGDMGQVAVTASTGLAAVNVGGITLHSFSGIGLGKEDADHLVKKIRRNRKALTRWKSVRVLIIDEVSMISGELFSKLDHIACEIRKNDKPFGGIQVVCCGDFFQLPPVSKEDERSSFCFDSHSWKRSMKVSITLQKVFRQKGDLEFIDMLNDMRLGIVTENSAKNFRMLERELPKDEIEPAELYSTRNEVERANQLRLKSLKSEILTYSAIDGGVLTDQHQRQRLLANFMAPEKLELKKGAQVMMIKNLDESLVNGSLGKVIDFMDRDTYLSFEKLRMEGLDDQTLKRNIETAKAKGKALEAGKDPESALSNDDLHTEKLENTIFDFMSQIETDDPEVKRSIENKIKLMNDLHESSRGQKLPLVRFLTPDNQSRTVLVNPETWTVEDEKQTPLVTRMQLPLLLAWALSIHKSQGQTLPRVRVNLKRVFENGQAYVAISRAVSREGLQVLNFHESRVFAHPRVVQFYQNLSSASDAKEMLDAEEVGQEEEVPKRRGRNNNNQPGNAHGNEIWQAKRAEGIARRIAEEDTATSYLDADYEDGAVTSNSKRRKKGPSIMSSGDPYSETVGRVSNDDVRM